MQPIKFRARVLEDGKPTMFYQEDQYLISFLRRVTTFLDFQNPKPRTQVEDPRTEKTDAYNGGVHESYLPVTLESVLDLFVGVEDKNKKEIYAGDILEGFFESQHGNIKMRGVVFWDYYGFRLKVIQKYSTPVRDGMVNYFDFIESNGDLLMGKVVIGNEFENPELL